MKGLHRDEPVETPEFGIIEWANQCAHWSTSLFIDLMVFSIINLFIDFYTLKYLFYGQFGIFLDSQGPSGVPSSSLVWFVFYIDSMFF